MTQEVKPQDHPDFIGGWIWTELEIRWIEERIAKATEEANARANASWELMCKKMVAFEREACAKVCDGLADMHEKMNQWGSHKTADTLAQAIRARGEQHG
jgi:hypothetical protein